MVRKHRKQRETTLLHISLFQIHLISLPVLSPLLQTIPPLQKWYTPDLLGKPVTIYSNICTSSAIRKICIDFTFMHRCFNIAASVKPYQQNMLPLTTWLKEFSSKYYSVD